MSCGYCINGYCNKKLLLSCAQFILLVCLQQLLFERIYDFVNIKKLQKRELCSFLLYLPIRGVIKTKVFECLYCALI